MTDDIIPDKFLDGSSPYRSNPTLPEDLRMKFVGVDIRY